MTIYIDLLLLLNFIYDFLLLMTVSVTLKRNIRIRKIFFGAFIGMLSTFIIFLNVHKTIILIIKIIASMFMILKTFGFKDIRYFFNNILYLYMSSVILAGFLYFLKIEFNSISYILVLFVAPIILYLYIKEQKHTKEIVNFYKKVVLTLPNNKIIVLNGFIDTGNKLKDPITNKYIILINKDKLKGIYNIRSPIYVPIHTVNKKSLLECIKIKKIIIDDIKYDNYLLGLSDNFKGFDGIDCLLNYKLMEE